MCCNGISRVPTQELRDLEVSAPSPAVPVEVEVCKPELTAALREIRTQYESIAVKNLQEAEEWYKSKVTQGWGGMVSQGALTALTPLAPPQFADLSDAANRNHEALRLAKQEMNESRRQIQSLTCEVDGLKGMVRAGGRSGGVQASFPWSHMAPSPPAERGIAAADERDGG